MPEACMDHVPPQGLDYLRRLMRLVEGKPAAAVADRVTQLVDDHERWRRTCCLDLLASDNLLSPGATRLLASDLATRVSEGFPGVKDFPPEPANRFVEEIEGLLVVQLLRFYHAPYVEWRLPSNNLANTVALAAVTEPGDTVLVQSGGPGGGNMGYQPGALSQLRNLHMVPIPGLACFDLDLDRLAELAESTRPKAILVGGGNVLFPYPVREIRQIADTHCAAVLYDAAHLGLLIATGRFQDPLREGAHILTAGTHKVAGGPVGGLIFSADRSIAQRIADLAYPALVQTRDANKYAAAAYAMAEMAEFGDAYADAMVANARALGAALEAEGFCLVGADRGYTMTHQLCIDLGAHDGREVAQRLAASGILLSASSIPGAAAPEPRHGLRLSTQEATRRGMTPATMESVARLMADVVHRACPAREVQSRVEELMAEFPGVAYCFDP
jgi:glycine hydroxymethyltransferase